MRFLTQAGWAAFLVMCPDPSVAAQGQTRSASAPLNRTAGEALAFARYHPTITPFPGTHTQDHLGSGLAVLGDVDGNGIADLAFGASGDHVLGNCWQGAVWIQFSGSAGAAIAERKIAPGEGGFTGALDPLDEFGREVAGLGDLDGDGIPDLAVGAPGDDDFQPEAGAVWLLMLNADGSVKREVKLLPPIVSVPARTPQGAPDIRVRGFGVGLANLGDLDGDGTIELGVGATHGDHPSEDGGCVWILSLTQDAQVLRSSKISATSGLFAGVLDARDDFGYTLARATDMDGNGVADLLVGAPGDDDGHSDAGALWRLSIAADGTVVSSLKLSESTVSGLTLGFGARFGEAAADIGDLDGDGIVDLAVGAPSLYSSGWLWLLFLNADGTVKSLRRHTTPLTSPYPDLGIGIGWPASVAALGDVDGNGIPEVLAAAPGQEADANYGRVWRLNLRRTGALQSFQEYGLVGWTAPSFVTQPSGSGFGHSALGLGDLDGDGGPEIAVGQPGDSAVWIMHLNPDRSVSHVEKWSEATGFLAGHNVGGLFGSALAWLGDVDGNGFDDLAVGAAADLEGHTSGRYGAVWILFLGPGGAVLAGQKINDVHGDLTTPLGSEAEFGSALAGLGDLDHDGVPDLAVSAPGRLGLESSGTVFVLFLNTDGTVKQEQHFASPNNPGQTASFGRSLASLGNGTLAIGELFPAPGRVYVATLAPGGLPSSSFVIAPGQGGFTGTPANNGLFGNALAVVGDLDKDGLDELAVSSPYHLVSAGDSGLVWILFLDASHRVRGQLSLSSLHPRIARTMDGFGWGLGSCGDLDGDQVPDLLVGTMLDTAFPVRCEFSMGGFGILRLQGALAKKGL